MKAFIEANFKMVDLNGDGIISGEEFRYNCITRIAVDDIKVVDEAFNRLMNVSPATHESRVLLWQPPPPLPLPTAWCVVATDQVPPVQGFNYYITPGKKTVVLNCPSLVIQLTIVGVKFSGAQSPSSQRPGGGQEGRKWVYWACGSGRKNWTPISRINLTFCLPCALISVYTFPPATHLYVNSVGVAPPQWYDDDYEEGCSRGWLADMSNRLIPGSNWFIFNL